MPSVESRLVSIETIVTRLDRLLIGEDGNGGLVQMLKAADEANKAEVAARHEENKEAIQKMKDRWNMLWGAAVALFVLISFLTGNGSASLDHVMKLLK
jgi:hypothetical protein